MVKVFYGSEKTNSYRPQPWDWSIDPFPAFRGHGQRYNAFLAVANGFKPWFSSFDLADNHAMSDDYCKIIKTKKGANLLVPCDKKEDERILLITARGGFRGSFGKIEAVGAEILWKNGMSMHCAPVEHIVARITEPDGYVRTETGERCSHGYTEIYSWRGGYFGLPTKEYEAAIETGMLFATHDTIADDLEKCQAKRAEQAESRRTRATFAPQLEQINIRLQACDEKPYVLGDTFFTSIGYGCRVIHHLYNEDELAEATKKAERAEKETATRRAYAEWQPRFVEATAGCTFANGDRLGDLVLRYYTNCVNVRSEVKHTTHYEYSADGLQQFQADLPLYEAEYQNQLRAREREEAERKAREAAEAAEREAKARVAEQLAQAEAEAKTAGLPGDIRVWHRNGRTNAGKAWVIGPNGAERECDRVDTMVCGSNSKRYHQNYEGDHIWNQILIGELVIKWSKDCTAAEHECEVIYRPETLTEAQLEHVAEIQQELEAEWRGLTGLASGNPSPSIGEGWLPLLR